MRDKLNFNRLARVEFSKCYLPVVLCFGLCYSLTRDPMPLSPHAEKKTNKSAAIVSVELNSAVFLIPEKIHHHPSRQLLQTAANHTPLYSGITSLPWEFLKRSSWISLLRKKNLFLL